MTMNDNISVTMDIFFIVSLFYSGLVGIQIYRGLPLQRFFFKLFSEIIVCSLVIKIRGNF